MGTLVAGHLRLLDLRGPRRCSWPSLFPYPPHSHSPQSRGSTRLPPPRRADLPSPLARGGQPHRLTSIVPVPAIAVFITWPVSGRRPDRPAAQGRGGHRRGGTGGAIGRARGFRLGPASRASPNGTSPARPRGPARTRGCPRNRTGGTADHQPVRYGEAGHACPWSYRYGSSVNCFQTPSSVACKGRNSATTFVLVAASISRKDSRKRSQAGMA